MLSAALAFCVWTRPTGAVADPGREPPVLASTRSACEFCAPLEGTPVADLNEAGVDSIGRRFSDHNLRLWVRTDSLYRAGFFGSPGTGEARSGARIHYMLRAWNGMDYLAQFAGDPRIRRTDERSLFRPFGRGYANTAVYPLRFLREGLVGSGGFCMHYDISGEFDEEVRVGGLAVRVRTDRIRAGDGDLTIPVLSQQMLSKKHKSVEMIYAERFCGRVRAETLVDDGDTLDLVTMFDLEGMYVRKAGVHRARAITLWRSRIDGDRDPRRPRIGGCAYFPAIQIRLSFLPDLGLDDLRDFDVPQPLVAIPVSWNRPRREWMEVRPDGVFSLWGEAGPRPAVLKERYPDL